MNHYRLISLCALVTIKGVVGPTFCETPDNASLDII